jgi:hypothetical protein
VFCFNVPLALTVAVLTPRVMPQGMTRPGSVDLASPATVTAGLGAVVFAMTSSLRGRVVDLIYWARPQSVRSGMTTTWSLPKVPRVDAASRTDQGIS